MVPQSDMSNMKSNRKELDREFTRKALFCIAAGTGIGLIVYEIFLYFHIAIFGWNLGLIFAPLTAGYVETVLANRSLGENIGAISAFILFFDTTFYSFILKNPTLGWNFITAGSILVILQAAFPTAVNYFLLVVIGGIISKFIKRIKTFLRKAYYKIKEKNFIHWEGAPPKVEVDVVPIFNEMESNRKINNLDFYFLTSSDMEDKKHSILGIYHSEVLIERSKSIINDEPANKERKVLNTIKEGKDECLIKIAHQIKEDGGNGILDLNLNYSLIGIGGDSIQISAMGMGIYIN